MRTRWGAVVVTAALLVTSAAGVARADDGLLPSGTDAAAAVAMTTGDEVSGETTTTVEAAPQAQSGITIWKAQGYYGTKAACVDVGEWYVRVRLAHAYACRRTGYPVGPWRNPYQLWLLVDWECGGGAAAPAKLPEQMYC